MAGVASLLLLLVVRSFASSCEGYGAPQEQGSVGGSPITESSGLAFARTRPGVWFTHNDSGGQPVLYAFELDGTYLEEHAVVGAAFGDWEAMSAGPCPDGDGACLYIGDVGDNPGARPYVSVYAVREPTAGRPVEVLAAWHASYPDGVARNSEALLVHPLTGRIDLITKEDGESCGVYRFPRDPAEQIAQLALVATLSFEGEGGARTVTGADWDPDGDRVVVRTYSGAWEWSADPCLPDAHWDDPPRGLALSDVQGEAIAYNAIGDIVVSSEGDPMVLKRLVCEAVGEPGGPCDTGVVDSGDDGGGGDLPPARDPGCGCGGGAVPGWLALLGLPALASRNRRRRCPDRSRRR